jgi:uncharacterized protein YhjY with autotransporter beta-barrel domain
MSLKVKLLLGAAVPLVICAPAFAQVQITTATTAPVQTVTGNADLTITSTGSITLDEQDGATAVTMNSNHNVTNQGTITLPDSDNATAVRILPGFTGSFTNSGTISLLEDYTRPDNDDDDDLDGPVAIGTGRTGVLLESGGAMTGDIRLSTGVSVEGNNSAGVSLQSALNGNYVQDGSVIVTGANSYGVDIRENVSGNVLIGGGTSANGENSTALRVLGDVGGEFMIDGVVTATGFTSTSISNYADPDFLDDDDVPIADRRDADDLLAGGPAVGIRGDLTRGFLLNGAAVGGTDPTDDIKDVIQDFNENRSTGQISMFGSSYGVLITPEDGLAGDELRLGLVRETILDTLDDDDDDNTTEVIDTFDYDYGFINRGTITTNGLNIGFAPTGVRIAGSADGTHQTIVEGGVFNGGNITAVAFEANATGMSIGSGASTPRIVNTGAIVANVNTETTHDAVALLIEAGANVPAIVNNGALSSNVRGYDGDAVAFRDLSGTVTSFTNTSRIISGYTDDDTRDEITSGLGRAIAVDLSHSLSGITFTQSDTAGNARIFGDVLFGVGDDVLNLESGEVYGNVEFGSGSNTLAMDDSSLFGNASFTGPNANVSLDNARMLGALSLGSAGGALSFTNNATYSGAITGTGALSMAVDNSVVNSLGNDTISLSSLALANNARVGFAVNSARIASGDPVFNVAGTADIAANTVFTPVFQQFVNQTYTLRLVEAGTLNAGGPVEAMLNAQAPYLFNLALSQPVGEQAIDMTLSVKTAEALGLTTRYAGAYDSVLDLLEQDDDIAAAITSLATEGEFIRGWSDLMPASDLAAVRLLGSNSSAAFGAVADRLDLITRKPDAPEGAWIEEFGVYHDSDNTSAEFGSAGGGYGVAAGLDLYASENAVIGGFGAIESIELDEKQRASAILSVQHTSVGAYGGWRNGPLSVNGTASVGFATFESDREIATAGLADKLTAEWDATTWSVGARANYTMALGPLDLIPYGSLDYMSVTQDGYTETAGVLTDLAIIAGEGDSSLATAGVGVALSGEFGSDSTLRWRPEISAGYRSVLSWENSPAPLQFTGGTAGQTFALDAGEEPEDALTAGLGLNIDSQFLNMKFGYDAELTDNAITHYGSVTLRLAFW